MKSAIPFVLLLCVISAFAKSKSEMVRKPSASELEEGYKQKAIKMMSIYDERALPDSFVVSGNGETKNGYKFTVAYTRPQTRCKYTVEFGLSEGQDSVRIRYVKCYAGE